jgi:predicted nucleic acid-binding protein
LKVLFDTNILIDHLAGVREAGIELNRHVGAAISVISWIEVMTGVPANQEAAIRLWLDRFHLIPIDSDIAVYATALRAERRLDLADALIVATAQATGRLLITRDILLVNEADDPPVHIPYQYTID